MGGYVGRPSTAVHRGIAMAVRFAPRTLVVPALVIAVHTAALAQTAAAPARPPAGPTGTTAAWTLKLTGDVRWQQVTPAGALLVSTDAALAGVDIDRGQVMWEKADLGGLPTDSVRLVEGSLLVEAARPGLLVILDPVTGAVLFDSRRPGLTQIVTRRVLPQSGTLLVHGRRANGPAVVALYDLVTGEQRWVNEGLFEQTEPKKKGLGGLMQGLVRAASEATALEVLQAGPDMIVVHTLMGLRALDARSGAVVQARDHRRLGARHRAAPRRDHHSPGVTARQSGDGQRAHRERSRADGAQRRSIPRRDHDRRQAAADARDGHRRADQRWLRRARGGRRVAHLRERARRRHGDGPLEEGCEDQGPARLRRADAGGSAVYLAARPGDERRGERHRPRHR